MSTETYEAEYQDMDMDENLKLSGKHLLPIEQEESKKMKSTPFSDLTGDQLTAIFGEGLRLQLCKAHLEYDTDMHRDHNLFGTIQVAPDFSPDPLLQNTVFDVINREFNNPIPTFLYGRGELRGLSRTSFPVSSTSVVQIAAKLYVTTDKLDDVDEYIDDHDRLPTVFRPIYRTPEKSDLLSWLRFAPFDNEAFHVCDDHTFINISDYISDMPDRCSGGVRLEGKDGLLELSYVVFKYAVDADLEFEFLPTSTLNNITGTIWAFYPEYGQYIKLYEYQSAPSYLTRGKMNLIRSVLAVPANSSFIIYADLYDYRSSSDDILSGNREFRVPSDRPSSEFTIFGEGCSLKLKVNWKLPSEVLKTPSFSDPSVGRLTERRKFFGAHSTPTMADPDEYNRWSLQEEIAKVFNTSLKRTFNLQEAVLCNISTCTKGDGGDYLCSSVMNIWPKIKSTRVYKGPKHAGLAFKDDIMGSDYKDMMERCVVCGPGFVKFRLCRKWIAKSIHMMLTVGIETWAPKLSVKKVIIYSVLKKMDEEMDSLRSVFIKETLARLLEYSGVVLRKEICHTVAVGDSCRHYHIRHGVDEKVEDKSFYESDTREILDLFREKGLPIGSEGDELLLVDLAVWWQALKEEEADWIVDVADVGERLHIERCITAAKRAGLIADDHSKFPLRHVGLGLDSWGDCGSTLCIRNAEAFCYHLLLNIGMADNWAACIQLDRAAAALAFGVMKYDCLKNDRLTDYAFSFDGMLNEEGNTALYLQYTHVRISSYITTSSKDIKGLTAEVLRLKHDDERELGLHLLQFTEVLGEVCTMFTPNILCDYLYGLCKKFNSLDSSLWLDVGSGEETSKLLLCKATEVVMSKCFDLLGITPLILFFKPHSYMC